jgi:uncharacterized membrane protein YhhN
MTHTAIPWATAWRYTLPWVLVASALLAIFSGPSALDAEVLRFVFKPLTTILIIAYAWSRTGDVPRRRTWVLVGLVFSLAGDIALMWPGGFVAGLVAFLLAHLAYLVAFTSTTRLASMWQPWVFYAALSAALLAQLWPGVPGALQIPVVAYVVCLAAMAAQAATWWLREGTAPLSREAGYAALGGLLFVSSDALLAINKFLDPLPEASLWVLSTYWAAQWCIATSLKRRPVRD